eukprot:362187-Chlamydomonas_euryale.AAC.2
MQGKHLSCFRKRGNAVWKRRLPQSTANAPTSNQPSPHLVQLHERHAILADLGYMHPTLQPTAGHTFWNCVTALPVLPTLDECNPHSNQPPAIPCGTARPPSPSLRPRRTGRPGPRGRQGPACFA